MTPGDVAGILGATLTTVNFLPQVVYTLKTKETKGLSALTLAFSFVGNIAWIINGFAYQNYPIVCAGFVTLGLLIPLLYMKYQGKRSPFL